MKKFLEEVAERLYAEFGDGISQLCLVFPGRRARLFFGEALQTCVGERPIWQPRYLSIDDMLHGLSPLAAGDHLHLVAELYKIYNEYHPEPFERFFRWGEMLLSDFDTIDKYLVDAEALYANISDIREIEERFSELFDGDDEALSLVLQFWRSVNRRASQSTEQQHFLRIWRSLHEIYTRYKERLRELGIGYTGMIYRDMAENPEAGGAAERFAGQTFCFVGFNALTQCEKKIMSWLREQGLARFYWDYDNYYFKSEDQEAGTFIRRNVAALGGEDCAGMEHNNFRRPKQIEVLSTPSDVLQCKALCGELEKIYRRQGYVDRETVVVLSDERLLLPVLHSIPPEVETVNVTMGYPLAATVPYVLLERLLDLHLNARDGKFSYKDVLAILSHPYIIEEAAEAAAEVTGRIHAGQYVWVEPGFFEGATLFERIFRPVGDDRQMQHYLEDILSQFGAVGSETEEGRQRKEFIFTIVEHILRLGGSARRCDIDLTLPVYISLLRQTLRPVRVPYEGEPLGGLQIMGVLETRSLDFENVIFLSLSDDIFPGRHDGKSYIPFSLGLAFGLSTPQDQEAIFAYYFYRLLSRASNVTLMYSSAADDQRTGEQSRYIYQLEYESPHRIVRSAVNLRIEPRPAKPIEIAKDRAVMERLSRIRFYPTKLNRYLDCPVKFYFADIERLDTPELLQPEITHLDVGNTLHRTMELLYEPLLEAEDAPRHIAAIPSERVERAVEQAMKDIMGARGQAIHIHGQVRLHRDIVISYARNIIRFDASRSEGFSVRQTEYKVSRTIRIAGREVVMAGIADRVDRMHSGCLRIVDYKSGGDITEFPSVESLFTDEGVTLQGELTYRAHNGAALQTLLYGLIFGAEESETVIPALYVARRMSRPDFSPYLRCKELGEERLALSAGVADELGRRMETLLGQLFDTSVPFRQTTFEQKCPMCDYRRLCRR